ncbi:DUF2798 domain-containing protein [Methylobacillus gramineus]|uniref:DUF2798 domain-containing protein n=1 Tax=Methylobacillus gramineus TaxID=755169 RepID=UPI001CFFC0E9|nr:DUF2798 domain-containing protein [Methylobacillus gramineus]MCB5185270.1 DUF2798 domain-containing protein [Methylobacillus gramineus]
MARKLPRKYRKILFALVMSASTSWIVSAIILFSRHVPPDVFLDQWGRAFTTAWPVVFVAIVLIAPVVDTLLNVVVERD